MQLIPGMGWYLTEPARHALCVTCGHALGLHTFQFRCSSNNALWLGPMVYHLREDGQLHRCLSATGMIQGPPLATL